MMRMIQSRSAGHAKEYFSAALSKSDYYTADQELPGFWQGRLAARLGLGSDTTREAFFSLCENLHPVDGTPLTPRTKDDRTTGYDINFHCPKSVSILHILSQDDHILAAFRESVTETMQAIELDSKTRIRRAGVYDDRETGELVWGHFIHQTARPVDGFTPDPHLHSHCFVFNATWDEQEQRIKAGQFRDIKRDMPYYEALFHKSLSDRLIDLGYQVRHTSKSFEVEAVPQRFIDLFSKRTDAIGRIAKEKGITNAQELDALGARTRAKKQKGFGMNELKEDWRKQINELGPGKDGEGEKTIRFEPGKSAPGLSALQCISHAKEHCFERASVVPDRRLLETALRHGIGSLAASPAAIIQAFKTDSSFIHVKEKSRVLCTTRDILREEKHMVDLARGGQGKYKPLYETAPDLSLLDEKQARAITHVLTTADQVSIIMGRAGTGKTTQMKEAVKHIEAAGKQVIPLAPTAQASRGVLRTEGFASAETVAMFLASKTMQEKAKGQVVLVDEAGLLGTKEMTGLLEVAHKQDARLILAGDTRQHASVVRGDALRILNTVAGIRAAEVDKIYRQQQAEYRAAVEDLSKGNVPAAFKKLDKMGAITTIDPMEANKVLVEDYMQAISKGKTALIVAPTHAQGEAVTKDIRDRLRSEGMIGKKEITVARLVNLNLTAAEKADHRNFGPGQFIQFNQNATGFTRGSIWEVQAAGEKEITVSNEKGITKALLHTQSDRYDVFRQEKIGLSKGDLIRITRNGFDADNNRLDNGDTLSVTNINKTGTVTLQNEKSKAIHRLDKDFRHIAHAHCITSYASQGKTVDEIFISQPAATFRATDAKQFYVSVSRGKEKVHIYTDDKEALLQHASEVGERQSALELIGTHTGKGSSKELTLQWARTMQQQPSPAKETITPTKQHKDYEPEI